MKTVMVLVFVIAMVDGRPAVENKLADKCPFEAALIIDRNKGFITGCLSVSVPNEETNR